MPEGNVIHRLAKEHTRDLKGHGLEVTSPQGRFAESAARIDGHAITKIEAYGKHLFYWWDTGDILHVHLGLYGKFHRLVSPADPPTYQARVRIASPEWTWDLVGPINCDLGDRSVRKAVLAKLGPDPLRRDADPDLAWQRMHRSKRDIGQVLMDQTVFAGVGNVYRAEVLFVHGIHPLRPANEIDRETFDSMWRWLAASMKRGVKEGRIFTIDDVHLDRPRRKVDQMEGRYVYRRDHCHTCATPVVRWDLAGRWAYACPTCQPPPRPPS